MKTIFLLICLFPLLLFSQSSNILKIGIWRGVLKLNDTIELPFNFEVKTENQHTVLDIMNADERIHVTEISYRNDSVFIKMPVFDSEFKCRMTNESLNGIWVNNGRKEKNRIVFSAKANETERFTIPLQKTNARKERWKATFEKGTEDEYFSVAEFNTDESGKTKGTFQTETGDYRYLEGINTQGKFMVSCFDGAHAFLFTGKIKGESIVNGIFYSGIHGHENFVASLNNTFELRNPDSLTYLKSGFNKIDFSFRNLEGKTISLSDEKYKNKVVIIQLMGTWCPNCMDEAKFLSPFYEKYNTKGLEIIGLAFERTDDFAKALSNVQRLKNKFNARYEFLITMKTGAQQASQALPMLNKVMAFPTTIYIDKKGVVRKIYTGFYGPATGDKYLQYEEQTIRFVEKLLKE